MLYAGISVDWNQCSHTNPKRGYIGIECVTEPLLKLRKSETTLINCLPQVNTIN